MAEARRAVELDPNSPVDHEALAKALIYDGRPAEAAEAIRTAIRLDPHFPAFYQLWLGIALFNEDEFRDATEIFRSALERNPEEERALVMLLATLGYLDATDDAAEIRSRLNALRQRRATLAEAATDVATGIDSLLIGPFTLLDVDYWPYRRQADRDQLRTGLARAGVPKESTAGASPEHVPGAATVTIAEARALHDDGATFVDVRTLEVYRLGLIPGAVLLDLKTDFSEAKLGQIADQSDPIVIYCEGRSVYDRRRPAPVPSNGASRRFFISATASPVGGPAATPSSTISLGAEQDPPISGGR